MLKQTNEAEFEYNQKPRKRIKLNIGLDENYNEFKGQCQDIEIIPEVFQATGQEYLGQAKFASYDQQKKRDADILDFIKKGGRKIRSIKDASKPQNHRLDAKKDYVTPQNLQSLAIKLQQPISLSDPQKKGRNSTPSKKKQEPVASLNKKPKLITPQTNGMNNWSKFLSQSSKNQQNVKRSIKNARQEIVGMDCQFVRSGQQELLGRVSIVSQSCVSLLDSYVRPQKKITDYVTEISGITYAHIKNAPGTKQVVQNMKKILYNRIIVGHTIWKDLQVCGLKQWKGWKAVIDINQYEPFQQKSGKLISLKNLSSRYLGRQIQQARHSSLEDAQATIALFSLKKKDILKQFQLIQ